MVDVGDDREVADVLGGSGHASTLGCPCGEKAQAEEEVLQLAAALQALPGAPEEEGQEAGQEEVTS
jgi:hypothetical protein